MPGDPYDHIGKVRTTKCNQLSPSSDAHYDLAGDSLRTKSFELDGRRGRLVLGIMFAPVLTPFNTSFITLKDRPSIAMARF